MMISESFLHHEIFSEIRPLQNIFTVFFFIVIGTLFSFSFLANNILQVLLVLVIITLIKFVLILVINLALKMHVRNAFEVAVNLAQVGEFAFLSATIGLENSWISPELNSLIIAVTILSLLLSPLLITNIDAIYERFREFAKGKFPKIHRKWFMAPENDIVEDKKIQNHIILCGYGRVGKYIALALRKMRFRFVLIDLDSELIDEAKEKNMNALYGDATSEEILIQGWARESQGDHHHYAQGG